MPKKPSHCSFCGATAPKKRGLYCRGLCLKCYRMACEGAIPMPAVPWHPQHPRCRQCKGTFHRHKSDGLCSNCHWRRMYRRSPRLRTAVRANAKRARLRNSEAVEQGVLKWRKEHPGKIGQYNAKTKAIRRAVGWKPIFRGDEVVAPFLSGQYRVIKTYVSEDGDAVCDLDNGYTVHKEVPLASLEALRERRAS